MDSVKCLERTGTSRFRSNSVNSPIDKQQIIRQLIAKHACAWSEFVESYQRLVFSRVKATAEQCRFDLDQAELEDICAEVFASLLTNDMRSLRQFRGTSRISTWLSVISRRVCLRELNRIRQTRSKCADAAVVEAALSGADPACRDSLGELIWDEQQEQIRESISYLKQADRELLEMYFNERLSYEEISHRAGISVNSVGPKLNRSVSRLRRLLGWN